MRRTALPPLASLLLSCHVKNTPTPDPCSDASPIAASTESAAYNVVLPLATTWGYWGEGMHLATWARGGEPPLIVPHTFVTGDPDHWGLVCLYDTIASGASVPASCVHGATVAATIGQGVDASADFNGDGDSDLLVQVFRAGDASGDGGVWVFPDPSAFEAFTPSATLLFDRSDEDYGTAAGIPDQDGDGFDDLLVAQGTVLDEGGVPLWVVPGGWSGEARLSDVGTPILAGEVTAGFTASWLFNLGDSDGDGVDEMVAVDSQMIALLPVDTLDDPGVLSDYALIGGYGSAVLAVSPVAAAGDVNGDGNADLLLGNASYDNAPSAVTYLFTGPIGGPGALVYTDDASGTITAGTYLPGFGISTAGVGDVDSDGFDDVAIGVRGPELYNDEGNGTTFIEFGPICGNRTAGEAGITLTSTEPDGSFGKVLAAVRHDGVSWLAVGEAAANEWDGSFHLFDLGSIAEP